jgi:phosphoribosylformylglycinamidine (FGAM) synthase PurS component
MASSLSIFNPVIHRYVADYGKWRMSSSLSIFNPVIHRYVADMGNRECPLPDPSLTLLYTGRYVGDYRI